MRYRPYESYYKPDVDWLDELPSNWEVRRTKTMLFLQSSKVGRAASEHVLLSLTLGGVVPRNISEGGKFPAEFDTYQLVKPNDLVFCLFDIDETPRTIGIARDNGMITGAYNVYSAGGACVPEYACYYFLHIDSFKGLRPFYTGLRKVVRADTFSKIEMPAPPVWEQTQIAMFLDYETARIDALIEKQQQLIALLKEKRQAVISHAVTKGLNPDAPMRDSGVEWLGEVPAHWELSKLKYLQGLNPSKKDARIGRSLRCTFLPMEKLKTGAIDTNEDALVSDVFDGYTYFKNGDILMAKVTPCFENKNIAIACELKNGVGFGSTEIYVIRPNEKVDREFLFYRLQEASFMSLGAGSMTGAGGLKRVPSEFLQNHSIALPPIDEQRRIAGYVKARETSLSKICSHAESGVALLQERRTALISAAVTGKIDVRNWKPSKSETELETETA